MKTVSLKTTLLAAALSFSSIFVNGLGNVMAQNAKDWYAPQSITTLDKKAYKEITNSFREKNSMDLMFHFEKSHWSIHRVDSDDKELLEDSAYISDLKSDFEDAVVKKSGIYRCDEFTPPYSVTLHYMS